MSLKDKLEERYKASSERIPPEAAQVMVESQQELDQSGIADKTLKVGDEVLDFKLPNAVGDTVSLGELLKKGPVVISFYRGVWCPYCSLELQAYQDLLSEFEALGATLVAISPQTPDNSLSTAEKNQLKYEVLSDVGNKVANQFGLVYTLNPKLHELYDKWGLSIPKFNGDDSWEIPIPATYVINTDGKVSYAFADIDYTKRAEPADVIDNLKGLG